VSVAGERQGKQINGWDISSKGEGRRELSGKVALAPDCEDHSRRKGVLVLMRGGAHVSSAGRGGTWLKSGGCGAAPAAIEGERFRREKKKVVRRFSSERREGEIGVRTRMFIEGPENGSMNCELK